MRTITLKTLEINCPKDKVIKREKRCQNYLLSLTFLQPIVKSTVFYGDTFQPMQQGTYETPLYKHNPLTHQLIGACVWWEKNLRLGVQRSEIIRCLLQPFPGKNSHPLDNILCSLLLCAFLYFILLPPPSPLLHIPLFYQSGNHMG